MLAPFDLVQQGRSIRLAEYPFELISIPGDVSDNGGVSVSVTDEITQSGDKTRQFKIRTVIRAEFLGGDTWSLASLEDFSDLQRFLDDLDAGRPTSWKAGAKGTLISVEHRKIQLPGVKEAWIEPWVTVRNESVPVHISMRMDVTDEWFERAYQVIDDVMDRYSL